jgi:hypothetical protein
MHDCRWQTVASARFASCTLGLSEATLKGEVLIAAFEPSKRPGAPGLKLESKQGLSSV